MPPKHPDIPDEGEIESIIRYEESKFSSVTALIPVRNQPFLIERLVALSSAIAESSLQALLDDGDISQSTYERMLAEETGKFENYKAGLCYGLSCLYGYYQQTQRREVFLKQVQKIVDSEGSELALASDEEFMPFYNGILLLHNFYKTVSDEEYFLSLEQSQFENAIEMLGEKPVYHSGCVNFKLSNEFELIEKIHQLIFCKDVVGQQVIINLNWHSSTFFVNDSGEIEYYDPNNNSVFIYDGNSAHGLKRFVNSLVTSHYLEDIDKSIIGSFDVYGLTKPSMKMTLDINSALLSEEKIYTSTDVLSIVEHIFLNLNLLTKKNISDMLMQIRPESLCFLDEEATVGVVLAALIAGNSKVLQYINTNHPGPTPFSLNKYVELIIDHIYYSRREYGLHSFPLEPCIDEIALGTEKLLYVVEVLKCIPFRLSSSNSQEMLAHQISLHNIRVEKLIKAGVFFDIDALIKEKKPLLIYPCEYQVMVKLTDDNIDLVFDYLIRSGADCSVTNHISVFDTSEITNIQKYYEKVGSLLDKYPSLFFDRFLYNANAFRLYEYLKSASVISTNFIDFLDDKPEIQLVEEYYESHRDSESLIPELVMLFEEYLKFDKSFFMNSEFVHIALRKLYKKTIPHLPTIESYDSFIDNFQSIFGVSSSGYAYEIMTNQTVLGELFLPLNPTSYHLVENLLDDGVDIAVTMSTFDLTEVSELLISLSKNQRLPQHVVLPAELPENIPDFESKLYELQLTLLPCVPPKLHFFQEEGMTSYCRRIPFPRGGEYHYSLSILSYDEMLHNHLTRYTYEGFFEGSHRTIDEINLFYDELLPHLSPAQSLKLGLICLNYLNAHQLNSAENALLILSRMFNAVDEVAKLTDLDGTDCVADELEPGKLVTDLMLCLYSASLNLNGADRKKIYNTFNAWVRYDSFKMFLLTVDKEQIFQALSVMISRTRLENGASLCLPRKDNLAVQSHLNLFQWFFMDKEFNHIVFFDIFSIDYSDITKFILPHGSLFEFCLSTDSLSNYFELHILGSTLCLRDMEVIKSQRLLHDLLEQAVIYLPPLVLSEFIRALSLSVELPKIKAGLSFYNELVNHHEGGDKLRLLNEKGLLSATELLEPLPGHDFSCFDLCVDDSRQFCSVMHELLSIFPPESRKDFFFYISNSWQLNFSPSQTVGVPDKVISDFGPVFVLVLNHISLPYRLKIVSEMLEGNFHLIARLVDVLESLDKSSISDHNPHGEKIFGITPKQYIQCLEALVINSVLDYCVHERISEIDQVSLLENVKKTFTEEVSEQLKTLLRRASNVEDPDFLAKVPSPDISPEPYMDAEEFLVGSGGAAYDGGSVVLRPAYERFEDTVKRRSHKRTLAPSDLVNTGLTGEPFKVVSDSPRPPPRPAPRRPASRKPAYQPKSLMGTLEPPPRPAPRRSGHKHKPLTDASGPPPRPAPRKPSSK